jgi:hypothetical protein
MNTDLAPASISCIKCGEGLRLNEMERAAWNYECPFCKASFEIPQVSPPPSQLPSPEESTEAFTAPHHSQSLESTLTAEVHSQNNSEKSNNIVANALRMLGPKGLKMAIGVLGSVVIGAAVLHHPSQAHLSSKEDFMSKVQGQFHYSYAGLGYEQTIGHSVPVDRWMKIMGKPDAKQRVGDKEYWYYNCSDGKIQVVVDQFAITTQTGMMGSEINQY